MTHPWLDEDLGATTPLILMLMMRGRCDYGGFSRDKL